MVASIHVFFILSPECLLLHHHIQDIPFTFLDRLDGPIQGIGQGFKVGNGSFRLQTLGAAYARHINGRILNAGSDPLVLFRAISMSGDRLLMFLAVSKGPIVGHDDQNGDLVSRGGPESAAPPSGSP